MNQKFTKKTLLFLVIVSTAVFLFFFVQRGSSDKLEIKKEASPAPKIVLEAESPHNEALFALGNMAKDKGDFSKAAEYYRESLKNDKSDVNVYLALGVVLSKMDDFDGAIKLYNDAAKLFPQESKIPLSLAYLSETKGFTKESIVFYKKAIELDPGNAEAYYNLGNIYTSLELNGKAIESYLNAVKYNPNHINAWINLSIVAYKSGQEYSAAEYLGKAMALGYVPPEEFRIELQKYK